MTNWYDILSEVKETKGKSKQDVLKKHEDNQLLKDVLDFLNNPRIVTGISKKKWDKATPIPIKKEETSEKLVRVVMDYLKNNKTGKDEDVEFVKSKISTCDDNNEFNWLQQLVTKDCPIGVSASTINKVWPGLIPVFKLMKGKKYEGEDIKEEFTLSLKLDGNSATVFNGEKETYMLSRSGAVMEGFNHILDYYRKHIPLGFVYCGELIQKNINKLGHGELFRVSNGIVNSKDKDKSSIQHIMFDAVPIDEYESKNFTSSYSRRREFIRHISECYEPYSDAFDQVMHIPHYYIGTDLDMIEELMIKIK